MSYSVDSQSLNATINVLFKMKNICRFKNSELNNFLPIFSFEQLRFFPITSSVKSFRCLIHFHCKYTSSSQLVFILEKLIRRQLYIYIRLKKRTKKLPSNCFRIAKLCYWQFFCRIYLFRQKGFRTFNLFLTDNTTSNASMLKVLNILPIVTLDNVEFHATMTRGERERNALTFLLLNFLLFNVKVLCQYFQVSIIALLCVVRFANGLFFCCLVLYLFFFGKIG